MGDYQGFGCEGNGGDGCQPVCAGAAIKERPVKSVIGKTLKMERAKAETGKAWSARREDGSGVDMCGTNRREQNLWELQSGDAHRIHG